MTTPTDTAKQYTDFVQQGQEATLKAVETWTRTVQDAFTQAPGVGRVDVQSAVDSAYDLAAKLLDVQRSYALWTQVYKGPAELIDIGDWIDRPSFGIPYTYTVTGFIIAEALRGQGRAPEAQKIMDTVRGMAQAARINDVLAAMGGDS